MTKDIDVIIGAVLHDIAENTEYSIKEEFLTHLQNASKESMIITMSDKLSNMRALCQDYKNVGDELWQRFNQKDVKQHEWYYRSIAEKTKEYLFHTDSRQEYVRLCDEVFGIS